MNRAGTPSTVSEPNQVAKVVAITTGNGKAVMGANSFDLATVGYQEDEYFVSGTATSYTAPEALTPDGRWTVATGPSAPYTTRVVVRRPSDPAAFNGTVVVEWLNVSGGLDASPDWTYAHVPACTADVNSSGQTEVADLYFFLDEWFAGCP